MDTMNVDNKKDICRFCTSKPGRQLILESEYGFAAFDRHPASKGHFLVIPYRHFASYFDIHDDEREDLWALVAKCKTIVDKEFHKMVIILESMSVRRLGRQFITCISM